MIAWLKQLSRRQQLGVVLLTVSTVSWTLVLFVPFLPMEGAGKVATATGLIVVGEVTGYPGLALLGKDAVNAIKAGWGRLKSHLGLGGKEKPGEVQEQEAE